MPSLFRLILASAACLAIGLPADAQTANSHSLWTYMAWPPPGRSDATRLPGDIAAPPVSEVLAPHKHGTPHLPPLDPTPAVPIALAVEIAQAGIAACKAQGLSVATVVTDSVGVLRVGISDEGASPPGRVYGAVPKAVAAVTFREPTSVTLAKLRADPALAATIKPNMLILPGGLPIIVAGKLLGAVAVSGASADQDEVCAKAALAQVARKLR